MEQGTRYRYKKVCIVGVDGGGIFLKNAPMKEFHRIFREDGHSALTYSCQAPVPTSSGACWGSMLTGVLPFDHELTNNVASSGQDYARSDVYPTLFRRIREAMPEAKLAASCTWDTILRGMIEQSADVEKETADSDEELLEKIKVRMRGQPDFYFIHLDCMDDAGHSWGYGSEKYMKELDRADRLLGQIWDAFVSAGMERDGLFIVTCDHGGHLNNHGGPTDTERYVTFAARGKTIAPIMDFPMMLYDIPAVVLWAFGIENDREWKSYIPPRLFTDNPDCTPRPAVRKETFNSHISVPTPGADGEKGIYQYLSRDRIALRLPFDGDILDAERKVTVTSHGNLSFGEGYFGSSLVLDGKGYLETDFSGGKGWWAGFTFYFWLKRSGHPSPVSIGESVLFADKRFGSEEIGTVLSLITHRDGAPDTVKLDVRGRSGEHFINEVPLPADARGNWVHLCLSFDRSFLRMRVNFEDSSANTYSPLIVCPEGDVVSLGKPFFLGQDNTGRHPIPPDAEIDEFLVENREITPEELIAVRKYYLGTDIHPGVAFENS